MGINGLLRALESIAIDRHLRYYQHKRMAVDGYCWLHKSVYLMTDEIVSNPNSKKYLIYLTRRLDRLLQYNIIPVIVFDGDKLPMKRLEEDERLKHRLEVTQQGRYLLNQGMVKEAQAKMIEGLDINPQMAYEFIQELKKRNIEYYVAPYEADVQLAYLSKKGLVDCVITEDSDLIALGCKRVLFKLDPVSDIGKEISYDRIVKCKDYSFVDFKEDKFLTFCILSGCDYFKLKGVGIKNAYNTIKNVKSYKKCLEELNNKNGTSLADIQEKFEKAFLTFRFQVVYCPIKKEMVYFSPLEDTKYAFLSKYMDDLSFLGKRYDKETTRQIVFGEIDPITHRPFHSGDCINCEIPEKSEEISFLNKKRNLNEYELDMNLDIRGIEEEKERKKCNEMSSSTSPEGQSKNSINLIEKKEKNVFDDNDSLAELNEFDDFLEKYDKIDKTIKKPNKQIDDDSQLNLKEDKTFQFEKYICKTAHINN